LLLRKISEDGDQIFLMDEKCRRVTSLKEKSVVDREIGVLRRLNLAII
jgi:hypothetical protein